MTKRKLLHWLYNEDQENALYIACKNGNSDTVRLVIKTLGDKAQAAALALNEEQRNALYLIAQKKGFHDIVALLQHLQNTIIDTESNQEKKEDDANPNSDKDKKSLDTKRPLGGEECSDVSEEFDEEADQRGYKYRLIG